MESNRLKQAERVELRQALYQGREVYPMPQLRKLVVQELERIKDRLLSAQSEDDFRALQGEGRALTKILGWMDKRPLNTEE